MKKVCLAPPLAFLLIIYLSGCGENGAVVASSEPGSDMQINIRIGKLAASRIASAEVVISASGWVGRTESLNVSGNTISGTVRQLPAGVNRQFVLNCYDASGSLAYTGETTADVIAGKLVSISISLLAVSSNVESTSAVVLTIRSPIVVNYRNQQLKSSATISGELDNSSIRTANDVVVVFTSRNSSGGPMGQYTLNLGTVPPGTNFFAVEFGDRAYAKNTAPVSTIDYVISHSLGGPDTGKASASAN